MKKLTAITVCSLSFAFGSSAFAQTSASDAPDIPGAPMTSAETEAPSTPGAPVPAATPVTQPTTTATRAEDPGKQMLRGWSLKDNVLGKNVYNEQDEKIGDIRDVILDSDGTATHYVVGVGGFLGMGEHSVSLPFSELHPANDRFTITGYTKDRLKALPEVEVK